MSKRLVDCHAHLSAEAFDADRPDVYTRAGLEGVRAVLVVGEDFRDNERVLAVSAAESELLLLPCLGLHPDLFGDDRTLPTRESIDAVKEQIRSHADALAAIGEVGLDRWRAKSEEHRRAQADALEEMAALANELDLPLSVHSRSAGHHTIDLLKTAGAKRVLMHAFDGKASRAKRGADAGYLFSIPPSVLHSVQKQKLVAALPLSSLALESDAPALGPNREERNEPKNVVLVQRFIAETHGVTLERVAEATTENAKRIFPSLKKILE